MYNHRKHAINSAQQLYCLTELTWLDANAKLQHALFAWALKNHKRCCVGRYFIFCQIKKLINLCFSTSTRSNFIWSSYRSTPHNTYTEHLHITLTYMTYMLYLTECRLLTVIYALLLRRRCNTQSCFIIPLLNDIISLHLWLFVILNNFFFYFFMRSFHSSKQIKKMNFNWMLR